LNIQVIFPLTKMGCMLLSPNNFFDNFPFATAL
jgi:hypothetical protein